MDKIKNKNIFTKKIKLNNNTHSNNRNYISDEFLFPSKTMISTSYLDSYLNLSKNKNKTINNFRKKDTRDITPNNKMLNSFDKIKAKIISSDKKNNFREFNLKLNSYKSKNEYILMNYKDKYKRKNNKELNFTSDIHNNTLKKCSSFSRFNCNITINESQFKSNYNRIFLRSKSKMNILNNKIKDKNSPLKVELTSMINNIKKEVSKSFYEGGKYDVLNVKERNIKKFNDFAISKLMDINDIKNQRKYNFFDYNYNRNYIKKRNSNFENKYKLIKIIPRNIKCYGRNDIKNKKIDEIFQNLK
jgi:hypothetical protein